MAADAPYAWNDYQNETVGIQTLLPASWSVHAKDRLVGLLGPGDVSIRPAIGILKKAQDKMTIDQIADQEFKTSNKPADWVKSNARIGGMRAIKIAGSAKGDPSKKLVEYYVQADNGYYLVQCVAPRDRWSTYNPFFVKIIQNLHFTSFPTPIQP